MIKQQVNQLLEKEMDRKEFLRHIGVAVAAVVGVSAVVSSLNRLQPSSSQPPAHNARSGYGGSVYGR
jgi:hypothetical protein